MTWIAFIRHGPTAWNAVGRVQGRSDIPLSPEGRAEVARWVVPADLAGWAWVASPLRRAVETAHLLGARDLALEERLVEASWGAWEGRTLADLRQDSATGMSERESRGLDFHPPGGESPRDVQARVEPWLAEVAEGGRPMIAVTHKGVIRAVYALATGWDMTTKSPLKLDLPVATVFALTQGGAPRLDRLNLGLVPR